MVRYAANIFRNLTPLAPSLNMTHGYSTIQTPLDSHSPIICVQAFSCTTHRARSHHRHDNAHLSSNWTGRTFISVFGCSSNRICTRRYVPKIYFKNKNPFLVFRLLVNAITAPSATAPTSTSSRFTAAAFQLPKSHQLTSCPITLPIFTPSFEPQSLPLRIRN